MIWLYSLILGMFILMISSPFLEMVIETNDNDENNITFELLIIILFFTMLFGRGLVDMGVHIFKLLGGI